MKPQRTVKLSQETIARADAIASRTRDPRAFYKRPLSLHGVLVAAIGRGLCQLSACLPPLSAT